MIWLVAAALAADVTGHVFAPSGAPWVGVDVAFGDGTVVTTTGFGAFSADVAPGEWTVTVDGRTATARVADGGVTEILVAVTAAGLVVTVEVPEGATPVDAVRTVTGTVADPDGRPVAGAKIWVRGADGTATTDASGAFTVELPDGSWQLSVVRAGFLPGGATAAGDTVTVTLVPEADALAELVVTAPRVEGGAAALLDERRDAGAVTDVLGAEQMARAGDSDAGSALRRVTGLTLVGGRFVYVRGLGERYSSTVLDGATLPSPEPERRVVPLDLFPVGLLESVVVQKTWTPDLPGEFGGGAIRLRTRGVPTERIARLSLSTGLTGGTTFARGLKGDSGPLDWLGADGGHRRLPRAVSDASTDQPLEEGDTFSDRGYSASELETFGEAMSNRWGLSDRIVPPDVGLSAVWGDRLARGGREWGLLAAGSFGSGWDVDRYAHVYTVLGEGGALEESHRYAFDTTTHSTRVGGVLRGGVSWAGGELGTTTLLSRSTDDEARIYEGPNRDVGTDIRVSRLRFVERTLSRSRWPATTRPAA